MNRNSLWYHFTFESGANPFIATNEETAKKNIRLWKRNGYKVKFEQETPLTRYYRVFDMEGENS